MSYDTAVDRYGSDRPDLRFGMAFEEITDVLKETQYAVFRQVLQGGAASRDFASKVKPAPSARTCFKTNMP